MTEERQKEAIELLELAKEALGKNSALGILITKFFFEDSFKNYAGDDDDIFN